MDLSERKRWRDKRWFYPVIAGSVALFIGMGIGGSAGADTEEIESLEEQVAEEREAKNEAIASEREQEDLVQGLTENARLLDNRILSCQQALDVATSVGADAIGRYSTNTETPQWEQELLDKIDAAEPAGDECWGR